MRIAWLTSVSLRKKRTVLFVAWLLRLEVGLLRKIKILGLAISSTLIMRPNKLLVSVLTLFYGFRLTLALFNRKTSTWVTDESMLEIF
jgi:hypothetical protein